MIFTSPLRQKLQLSLPQCFNTVYMHEKVKHTQQMLQSDVNVQAPTFRAQGARITTLDMTTGSYTNNMRPTSSSFLRNAVA